MKNNVPTKSETLLKLAVIGAGTFAPQFVRLFQDHPHVHAVTLADKIPERLAEKAAELGIRETHASFEAALESDCHAVAIFTQRQSHGPMAAEALRAGKHVYSAVPVGMSVEEIREIEKLVRSTGLIYMLGETSYYYPTTIFCREAWRRGLFGSFVYGEGEYLHDMDHFYKSFQHSGGPEWRRLAGLPPMYYPTHTASMIAGVTGAHFTQVSCLGRKDEHEDGIFRRGANLWDNEFSNETALLRTSDGGMARLNEFRRIGQHGGRTVRLAIFGTKGCFEEQPDSDIFSTHDKRVFDLRNLLRGLPPNESLTPKEIATLSPELRKDFESGLSPVHPVWRLPKEFLGKLSGHHGSHQFLVDDFVRACHTGALPPNHIWAAARYNIPGLIAHESALLGGKLLEIPDLGDPPCGSRFLEDELAAQAPSKLGWALDGLID